MKRRLVTLALLLLLPALAPAEELAIVGAKVYLEPGKAVEGATVVVSAGRIKAAGAGVAVPAGARKIDGAGKVVTAGLIESQSQLGMLGVDQEPTSGEIGVAVADKDPDVVYAAYRVTDAYHPASVAIPIARSGGVTSALVTPEGGLVAGSSAWYPLGDGQSAPIKAPLAMHASLGIKGAAAARGSRALAALRLREVLDDAATYGKNRAAYERNAERRMAAGRLDLEALQPVLAGRIPLVVNASRESDIRAALALARERRLRLIIAGGTEAWRVAADLARDHVPVILSPIQNLPSTFDDLQVRDDAAAVLAAAGVDVIISGIGSDGRALRQNAGVAVQNGMPWDQALAAITTTPARVFGVTDRGAIKPGAAADLVVWSGDPLELGSRAETVIIDGTVQPAASHQSRLLERYRRLPVKP